MQKNTTEQEIRTSKKYPRAYNDNVLEEMSFSDRITHELNDATTIKEAQARTREIFYRYSISSISEIAQLPSHVAHALWVLITGDSWGKFRRKIRNHEIFNPSDEQVTHERM